MKDAAVLFFLRRLRPAKTTLRASSVQNLPLGVDAQRGPWQHLDGRRAMAGVGPAGDTTARGFVGGRS